MEIDALVVMDDRVLLLELKDWNGQLTHQNDRWLVEGQSRGRSAVILANEKAKKLKTVLGGDISQIKSNLWVDFRVVLTATSTREHLHESEKPFVWTLTEACSIPDPVKKAKLLKPVKLGLFKLFKFEKDFDRVTGNVKIFQPLEADWSGYRVVEEDVFVHPRGVWRDHRAERKGDTRLKAMVRTWSFDKLPAGLNSPDRRRLIAHRESKAFAHLSAIGSELVNRNLLLREIGHPSEEILTHHFEVRAIAQGMLTLDRYLEKARDDLSAGDRLLIATRLINIVAQLHRCSVTHRDIGPRSVWIGGPTSIAITGFMSCQLPDEESVVDWLTTLRGYAPDMPEDRPPSLPSTGRQRDVYLTAYLVALVLTGSRPTVAGEGYVVPLPVEFNYLEGWLRCALSDNPAHRFEDVASMENEFAELGESSKEPSLDQSLLDRFDTKIIPYQRWITRNTLPSNGSCTVYTASSEDGAECTVKVWNGIMRGVSTAIDLALIRLLDSASRVKAVPVAGLPIFIELGLSPVGPYVVYRYQTGVSLRELGLIEASEALRICLQLISAVTALHDLGCDHGDISHGNTIYDRSSAKLCLLDPFDISPVGDGMVRTPALCPDNWERLSQQSLDRYAVLRIAHDLLANHHAETLAEVKSILDEELKRPIIETLEVTTSGLLRALEATNRPPVPCFSLSTKIDSKGFDTGGVTFFLSRRPAQGGLQRYTLTSQKAQMVLQGDEHKLVDQFFIAGRFEKLAYESSTAMPISLQLSLTPGPEGGFDDLYQYLRTLALEPEQTSAGEGIGNQPGFDVARHWQRQMDLETNDRIEIELTEEVASREGVSVYRYVNLGRGFDFDPVDTVDVYANSNKRIGEVDHSLSDFAGTVGIRNVSRRLSIGDRVFLVDRREQASIDRRAKAIRRILERQSAIPNLVEFFYPDTGLQATDFGLVVPDEELAPYGLNQGQQDAFRYLLRYGPVGLLQGPPGTGKTRFIAAFVHWLVTKGGNQRVLIASQSHEAVNNVIDSLLLLYKRQGGQPNLLRIGSKGITERIRPFHTAELRERYRVRFEAAAKFRFTQLTSAKGIGRAFASDVFDLDQGVGTLARRCADLQQLALQEVNLLAVDRDRNTGQLKRVQDSLSAAAKQFLGRAVDVSLPLEELEAGFQSLLQKHPDSSPADLTATREILRITHEWLSSLASPQRNFEEFLAKTRSVVTATCVGVGQTRIRIDSQIFDWVIVDEAARCTPGELAVPIQLGRRVLLVGDHLQLKPMVSKEVIDQLEEEDPAAEREHFIMSDFERAFTSPFGRAAGRRFTEQYRMDPAICDLVSACFYEPHQVSLTTSDLRRAGLKLGSHTSEWFSKPLTWIDTSVEPNANETKLQGRTTFHNDVEVLAIMRLLESLSRDQEMVRQLAEGDEETPIGVICMYSGQKSKIDMAWARHSWEPKFRRLVRIDTVDSYQGKENSIVILSLVRNNPWQDIGHVGSANRCNVAVSRAKEKLIVVGAKRMWESVSEKSPMRRVLTFIASRHDIATIVDAGALR